MLEMFAIVLPIIGSGLLALEAFRQKERADRLQALNTDVLDNNDNLIRINLEIAENCGFLESCVQEIETERERLQQMYDERPGMVEHRAAETILDALDTLKRNRRHLIKCEECDGKGGRWDETGIDQWYECWKCS